MQALAIFGLLSAVVLMGFVINQSAVFQSNTVALTGHIRQFIGSMSLYFMVLAGFVAMILLIAVFVMVLSYVKS